MRAQGRKKRSKEARRLEARLKTLKTEIMELEAKMSEGICSYD